MKDWCWFGIVGTVLALLFLALSGGEPMVTSLNGRLVVLAFAIDMAFWSVLVWLLWDLYIEKAIIRLRRRPKA